MLCCVKNYVNGLAVYCGNSTYLYREMLFKLDCFESMQCYGGVKQNKFPIGSVLQINPGYNSY